jgi:hypothetical protein
MSVDIDASEFAMAVDAASAFIDDVDMVTPWQALHATGLPHEVLAGDLAMGSTSMNIYVAVDVSQLAIDIMNSLKRRHQVDESSMLVYAYEGEPIPSWPIAKVPPPNGYKEPHLAFAQLRSRLVVPRPVGLIIE